MNTITETSFLKQVAGHEMKVHGNNGLYRHVLFKSENNSRYWFEIVTWPGVLVIRGDLGSFMFTRIEDMIDFFNHDNFGLPSTKSPNFGYWAEKCVAQDKDGIREFSLKLFQSNALEAITSALESAFVSGALRKACLEQFQDDVLDIHFHSEYEAQVAINDFEFDVEGETIQMTDFYEYKNQDYTYSYTWCCYAIAWACKQIKDFQEQNITTKESQA